MLDFDSRIHLSSSWSLHGQARADGKSSMGASFLCEVWALFLSTTMLRTCIQPGVVPDSRLHSVLFGAFRMRMPVHVWPCLQHDG